MSIEIKGFEAIEIKIKKLIDIQSNTKLLMQSIGNILSNTVEESFEKEQSPFGMKWKPLKESTLEQKMKKGKSSKVLRSDGNLADRWIVKADNTSVSVSNNTNDKDFPYGLTHQFGTTTAGRGKNTTIPAREFLPIDKNNNLPKEVKETIKDAVEEFILKAVK